MTINNRNVPLSEFKVEIEIAKIEHPLVEAGRMFVRNLSAVVGLLMLFGIVILTLIAKNN